MWTDETLLVSLKNRGSLGAQRHFDHTAPLSGALVRRSYMYRSRSVSVFLDSWCLIKTLLEK